MKTITQNVYTFDELSEEARKKVLENLRDMNVDFVGWDECVLEDMKEQLEKAGFMEPKIFYSGFSSQGDGACFDVSYIDVDLIIANSGVPEFAQLKGKLVGGIKKNSYANHYSHAGTRYVELDYDDSDEEQDEELLTRLTEYVEQRRVEYCYDIYNALGKEYDYQTSDEAVIEAIRINEYLFYGDGILVPYYLHNTVAHD